MSLQENCLCGVLKWSFYRANLIFVTKASALRIYEKLIIYIQVAVLNSENEECKNTNDKHVNKYPVKSEGKTKEPNKTCKISLCTINVCISMTFPRFHRIKEIFVKRTTLNFVREP